MCLFCNMACQCTPPLWQPCIVYDSNCHTYEGVVVQTSTDRVLYPALTGLPMDSSTSHKRALMPARTPGDTANSCARADAGQSGTAFRRSPQRRLSGRCGRPSFVPRERFCVVRHGVHLFLSLYTYDIGCLLFFSSKFIVSLLSFITSIYVSLYPPIYVSFRSRKTSYERSRISFEWKHVSEPSSIGLAFQRA